MSDDNASLLNRFSRQPSKVDLISCNRTPRKIKASICLVLLTETLERFAFYGLLCNMALFLNAKPLLWSSYNAINTILIFYGISYLMTLIGGWIADAFLNKFRTIIVFFIVYIFGFCIWPSFRYQSINKSCQNSSDIKLWCASNQTTNFTIYDTYHTTYSNTTSEIPDTTSATVPLSHESCSWAIFLSLTIVGIGFGAVRANLVPFGASQVASQDKKSLRMYFNWLYWCINLGSFMAYGLLGYLQQNVSGFYGYLIPTIALVLAFVVFALGSMVFEQRKETGSPLSEVVMVLMCACRNVCRGWCCRIGVGDEDNVNSNGCDNDYAGQSSNNGNGEVIGGDVGCGSGGENNIGGESSGNVGGESNGNFSEKGGSNDAGEAGVVDVEKDEGHVNKGVDIGNDDVNENDRRSDSSSNQIINSDRDAGNVNKIIKDQKYNNSYNNNNNVPRNNNNNINDRHRISVIITENKDDKRFDNFRCLDAAKASEGGPCKDEYVNNTKAFLLITILFLTIIPYWTVYYQMQTTFQIQGLHMKLDFHNHTNSTGPDNQEYFEVPTTWLSLFNIVFIIIFVPLLDRIIYPFLDRHYLAPSLRTRILIGMVFSSLSMFSAGVVERQRLKTYWGPDNMGHPFIQYIACTLYNAADLSVFWQVPQYVMIGISEVFTSIAVMELAYTTSPKSIQSIIMGLFYFSQGVGSILGMIVVYSLEWFWFPSFDYGNINCQTSPFLPGNDSNEKCHLDYYFFFLGALQLITIFVFMFVSWYLNIGVGSVTKHGVRSDSRSVVRNAERS